MSNVKRYGFDRVEPTQKDGWAIREKPNGHLVSVADYDSRVADIARLTERVRELEDALGDCIAAFTEMFPPGKAIECTYISDARAALAKREGG